MSDVKKEYSNGELTVVWEPKKCIHSGNCVRGLPSVFKPDEKPWIQVGNATTQELKTQIDKCPSGALSYFMNGQSDDAVAASKAPDITEIKVLPNGPVIVNATCKVIHKDGREELRENKISLCRCGQSSNKPYCDGSHKASDFRD